MRTKREKVSLNEKYMRLAIQEASNASLYELPIGVIVVLNWRVIGRGTPEDHIKNNPVKHAEVIAIEQASQYLHRRNLQDCTIYTTVEPCNMCASLIFQAKINKIVFGVSREKLSFLRERSIGIYSLAADAGYTPEIISGVLEQEILKIHF